MPPAVTAAMMKTPHLHESLPNRPSNHWPGLALAPFRCRTPRRGLLQLPITAANKGYGTG